MFSYKYWMWAVALASTLSLQGCLVGCSTTLDRQLHEARVASFTADKIYLTQTTAAIAKGAQELIESNRALRAEAQALRENAFWARHTDDEGRLVSKSPDGTIKPMLVSDIKNLISDIEDMKTALREDQARQEAFVSKIVASAQEMLAAKEKQLAAEDDILANRESAAAIINAAVGGASGLAAGYFLPH